MADFETDFNQIADVNVTDDIIFPVKDVNAAVGLKGRWITLAQILGSAVRKTAGVVAALEVTGLVSGSHQTSTLSVGAGVTVSKILSASTSVTLPDATAGAEVTTTMTVSGCATGDMVLIQIIGNTPNGLFLRGYVSAADTVTVEACNTTGATIGTASYTMRAVTLRFA